MLEISKFAKRAAVAAVFLVSYFIFIPIANAQSEFVSQKIVHDKNLVMHWVPSTVNESELNKNKYFAMSTEYKEYKTGATSIVVQIYNNSKKEVTYGDPFILERKADNGWYMITQLAGSDDDLLIFSSIGYGILAKSSRGDIVYLTNYTGPLQPGEYRIIKDVLTGQGATLEKHSLCAEFSVSERGYDSEWLSGYAPLSKISTNYTQEQANSDEAIFKDAKGKTANYEKVLNLLEKYIADIPAKLRMFKKDAEGQVILTDVTFDRYRFKVEQKTSASKAVKTKYYPYIALRKNGKVTQLALTSRLGMHYPETDEFVILGDIRSANANKIAALVKKIPIYDTSYTVIGPQDSRITYIPPTAGFQGYIDWIVRSADGKQADSKTMSLSEFGGVKGVVLMKWLAASQVEIMFETNSGGRLKVILDLAQSKIVESSES